MYAHEFTPDLAVFLLFISLMHSKYTPNSWPLSYVYFANSLLRLLQQYLSNYKCFPTRKFIIIMKHLPKIWYSTRSADSSTCHDDNICNSPGLDFCCNIS